MCWPFDVKCILGLVARLCALPAVTEAAKLFHTSDVRTLRQQWQPTLFLGAFGKLRKATTSFIMCVCPSSVLLEQLGPHRTDFHEIWYLSISFSGNNNKMQLCNRIYYSKVYWRLNMFRAVHRSSSGALHCVCSLWFIYPCGDRPLPRLSGIRNEEFVTQNIWRYSRVVA